MNIEKELLERPGIFDPKKKQLKKSYSYIENLLGIDKSEIKEAVNNIKKGVKIIETPNDFYIKMETPNSIKIDKEGTYLVTGCSHAPFQNKKFYNSIYSFISAENIALEGLILAGDILDMHSLSKHDRGKAPIPGVTLGWEYREANKFLNELESILPEDKQKIFLYGNHEDRYFRTLSEVDASKYGDSLLSPTDALKLYDRGFEVMEDWKSGHIDMGGKLEINHGEFFNVHTAKKTIDTYRKSVLYFHSHRLQIYTEGAVGGWNMGWGGDVNSPVFNYASRAMKKSWMNAAALVTLTKKSYHVQPLLYINDQLVINGKIY